MYYDEIYGLVIKADLMGDVNNRLHYIDWKQVKAIHENLSKGLCFKTASPWHDLTREEAGFILANPPIEFINQNIR